MDSPGAPRVLFQGHVAAVNALAFAPVGELLASGSDDQTIRLWNPSEKNELPQVLADQASPIRSLAFSPGELTLASGSSDGRIFLWDLSGAEPAYEILEGHQGSVLSLVFSPDGQRLASGSADGSVRLWDLITRAEPVVLYQEEDVVWSVTMDGAGRKLAAAGADGLVRIWALDDLAAAPGVRQGHEGAVYSVAFAPGGERLVSGGRDGMVRLWDLTGSQIQPLVLEDDQDMVVSLSFSPDGGRLASTEGTFSGNSIFGGRTIRLWDLSQPGVSPLRLQQAGETILKVDFSPDGQHLASAGTAILLWDLADNAAPPQTLLVSNREGQFGQMVEFQGVAFAPDGRHLATTGLHLYLWNLAPPAYSLEQLGLSTQKVEFSEYPYRLVAFSADGQLLAATNIALQPDTIHFWNLAKDDKNPTVMTTSQAINEYRSIHAMAFTPDGETFIWQNYKGQLSLGNPSDIELPPVELPVKADIMDLAVSPNGQNLALAFVDGMVQVWSLANLAAPPIILRGHEGNVLSVAYSPDGLTLASGGEDGTIRLWPTLDRLREIGCQQVGRNLTPEEWALYLPEEPYRETCP